MAHIRPVKVIAVTGGKGGVGKTNVAVNVAMALCQLGRRVTLLDADLGLANVDIALGLKAEHTIADVLSGQCSLLDIQLIAPEGLHVIPASSGIQQLATLSEQQHAGLISAFSELANQIDVLVIDTAAGISSSVTSFVQAAQQVMVVINDEPASITDAYALIKLLNREYKVERFNVVTNRVKNVALGKQLFQKLLGVTDRFLEVALYHIGSVPEDEQVYQAAVRQRAVLDAFPRSKAALAYKTLAKRVDELPPPRHSSGHLEFFAESLLATGTGF